MWPRGCTALTTASKPRRFRSLYLHIGLGKTGSTSIQQDLLAGADLLESKYDLHLPRNFTHTRQHRGNHSMLLRSLFSDDPEVRKRLAAQGLSSTTAIEQYNQKTLSQLHAGFASSNASNLLLTAEGVGHFKKPQLEELAHWLKELAGEIKIVACVRHPVHALSSEIQQRLMIGEILEDMYEQPPVYLFSRLFRRFEQAFGKENIIAYDFADAIRSPDGLTAEFLRRIGIEAAADFPMGQASNTSMSHEGALLLSAINRLRPILIDGERNPERLHVNPSYFKKIPGRTYTAPTQVYARAVQTVQGDIDWLLQEYAIDLGGFDAPQQENYNSFSDQSIEYLALSMAEYDRLRHPVKSRARSVRAFLRSAAQRLLRWGSRRQDLP